MKKQLQYTRINQQLQNLLSATPYQITQLANAS